MKTSEEKPDTVSTELRLQGKKVLVTGLDGDHIATTIAKSKLFYEWQMLGALAEYLAPGDYVVDVGANIGNHSLYFAAVCDVDVLAFEPLDVAADILQINIEQNFLDDKIELRRHALGAFKARAKLSKFDPENVGATSFALTPSGEFRVSSLDLEKISRRVALLKVDAEGMDLSVLKGAADLIARDRPIIVCEAATKSEQTALEEYVAEISYTFVAEFNATPTYILAPARTAREKAAVERRRAALLTRTNLATRDLYYRISLVAADLKAAIKTEDNVLDDLKARVEQAEVALQSLMNRSFE